MQDSRDRGQRLRRVEKQGQRGVGGQKKGSEGKGLGREILLKEVVSEFRESLWGLGQD